MMKKRVSIEDVARRAGVSITTVSRVLNQVPTVSEANKKKVEEAIAYFHFKPNVTAQRLATGVNNSVGLVMPGYPGIFHSFYAIEIIRGVGHACEVLRLDMVFHITNGHNPLTSAVGGLVFADVINNRQQVEDAVARGVPCMIINHRVDDLAVNYIAVDNFRGGFMAADYLVDLGHRRVATVTGNLNTQAGAQRLEGFKEAVGRKGLDLPTEYVYSGDYSRRCARSAAEYFLGLNVPPTAIFAASDEMALEIIAVYLEKGRRVPEDISVIGFDDNPACLFGPVGVTTIRQPLFQMAESAVRNLNRIMKDAASFPQLYQKVLSPELVIRESCAPFSHS